MDFWDVFWLLLIFIPLLLIWAFALVDIFRRDDLTGWQCALWVLAIIVLPFLGTLAYLIFRPPAATPEEREAIDKVDSARDLKVLSDLHDRGKLNDAEFLQEKARILK